MKLVQFLSGVLSVLFVTGCSEATDQPIKHDIVRPAKIFVVPSVEQRFMRKFPAEVEYHQGSILAFRVSGVLQTLNVLAGQNVTRDQLLASLDPEDFQLKLDDRKARYELAKSQYSRLSLMLADNLVSVAKFDEATANMLVAESIYKKAQTDLAYTQLKAPFSGSISQLYVENFQNIQAKQNILFLQSRDLLDVSIQVPEYIVARVKKDHDYQPSVIFDSFSDQAYKLTLKEWDTTADPMTMTYKVVFSLPKPKDFNLFPGMTGNVHIDLAQVMLLPEQGYIVPVEAVLFGDKQADIAAQSYVWLFNEADSSIKKVAIEVGNIHENGIEVLSGITSGDQIIAAGGHYLRQGMKVRPWTREQGL